MQDELRIQRLSTIQEGEYGEFDGMPSRNTFVKGASVTSQRPPFPAPRPDSNPYDHVPTETDIQGYATINDVGQLRKSMKKDSSDENKTMDASSLPDFLDNEDAQSDNFNKAASRRVMPETRYLTPRPSEHDLSVSAHSLLNGARKVSRDISRVQASTDSIARYDSPRPSMDGSNVYLHNPHATFGHDAFSINHDYDIVCIAGDEDDYDIPSSYKQS